MIEVKLQSYEIMEAALVGVMRQVQNLRLDRKDAHGAASDKGWQIHIEGACGEMVVAKHLGLYWSGAIGNLHADDVGNIQVRTRSKHHYDLILHRSDPDDRIFVLVTGTAPMYRLQGWLRCSDGKQDRFWKDPAGGRAAYFVPVAELRALPIVHAGMNLKP